MKTVRAKFHCNTIEEDMVQLSAVYGTDEKDNEENNQFSDATPYGVLDMMISNPKAKDFFEVGEDYYLDFQKVNK